MAGGSGADLDDVLSLGFERKVLVKRRYAVDAGYADIQRIGDEHQVCFAQIVVLRLHILQDSNKIRRIVLMRGKDAQDLLCIRLHSLPPHGLFQCDYTLLFLAVSTICYKNSD